MRSQDWAEDGSNERVIGATRGVDSSADRENIPTLLRSKSKWWKLRMRSDHDNGEQDWWFASTAIPLLAATIAPLANVLSIAALVTYWRQDLLGEGGELLTDLYGIPFPDPRWCYWFNVVSLILGFIGNFFLLMNFTGRVRYIIALPATIVLWYLATGILIGITVSMNVYVPPMRPYQGYTQGFWYAVIAAVLYLICSMILMVNMLGYFLGHYPQRFELTDHQRTLILQTMMFFVWLAGGAAVFARVETDLGEEPWSFIDGLYFCDVTILTIGFGDVYPKNDPGRGLVFPYSVGGIVMLGLVISSISKFLAELGEDKVIKRHFEKKRIRTMDRTVSNVDELERRMTADSPRPFHKLLLNASISKPAKQTKPKASENGAIQRVGSRISSIPIFRSQQTKVRLLHEERDRFNEMRRIQKATARFKRWSALSFSMAAFTILWAVGAVVFWQLEKDAQDMTYFRALYFCYVSLLTIGYGDLAPKSSAGRPFFLVWSLLAVPTMTILINSMGDTVIASFNEASSRVADFTILPQQGIWRDRLGRYIRSSRWFKRTGEVSQAPNESDKPHSNSNGDSSAINAETVQNLHEPSELQYARDLSLAIRRIAEDLKATRKRKYSYEEWVEFTRLIRFTTHATSEGMRREEEEEGLIEWDWIGEDSPMMSEQSEAEFVLDRLCESLLRYIRRQARGNGASLDGIRPINGQDVIEEVQEENTQGKDRQASV